MKLIKQPNDYGCGVYSLKFLLSLYGIEASADEIEKVAGTNEEDGTSHTGIKKVLSHFNLKWISWYNSHISTLEEFLPAIINYQSCDKDGCDGHYVVVLSKVDDAFIIYNPETGEIERLTIEYLKDKWYSERYGNQWFLQITRNLYAYN